MKKKSCAECGVEFMAKGVRKYCSDKCSLAVKRRYDVGLFGRMGPVALGYSRSKANALRDVPVVRRKGVGGLVPKSSPEWRIKLSEFGELVGKCFYCGGEGYGVARVDNSGVWVVSNVVCCCGVCGNMRKGASHLDFLGRIQRIVSNNGGSNGK